MLVPTLTCRIVPHYHQTGARGHPRELREGALTPTSFRLAQAQPQDALGKPRGYPEEDVVIHKIGALCDLSLGLRGCLLGERVSNDPQLADVLDLGWFRLSLVTILPVSCH